MAPKVRGEVTREVQWTAAVTDLTGQDIWAHVVSGEAGALEDGALLVAWTLRSWEVHRGMPAELAGPRWGWYGWKEPYRMHYDAVASAWKQPMSASPFAWMREGKFCRFLGNDADVRYWDSLGWVLRPIYRLEWPEYRLTMNCLV